MHAASSSIAKLAPALVAAQAEVQHAIKDSKNPHFKSTFASLESVIDAIKPVYARHGLTVVQLPGWQDGLATVETIVLHESGEWISGVAAAPLQKPDPQGVGSALTYLRRYSLAAVGGIAQVDDDGHAASAPASVRPSPSQQAAAPESTDGLIAEVKRLLQRRTSDAARKAALDAIEHRDDARLRAAIAYLTDQQSKGE